MGPFSVHQSSQERTASAPRWRRLVAWTGALGVVAVAAVWFWVISVPGAFILTLVPFVLFFALVGVAALAVLLSWISARRSGVGSRVPVPALIVVVMLLAVVAGTRADLSVRLRFERSGRSSPSSRPPRRSLRRPMTHVGGSSRRSPATDRSRSRQFLAAR